MLTDRMTKSLMHYLVAALVLLLTATHSLAQDRTILRFMHWQDGMTTESAWWDDIVSRFEAAHSGVTVETNWVPFDQYLPTLEAMIAGENLPDVFFGHNKTLEMGRAGLVIDFAKMMPPEYLERFFPGPLRQTMTSAGEAYGLPLTAQMFGLFVNPKIMHELGLEPPQTWDELLKMTPAIRKAGYVPLVWGNAGGFTCPDFFLPLIKQYGGDVYALDELAQPDTSWNAAPVVNALRLMQHLAQSGVFVDGINAVSEMQARQIAYQGRAAMMYNESSVPAVIPLEAPPEYAESYDVVKVPALNPGDPHWAGDGTGESLVVNARSPSRDLAIAFVQFLLSDEIYQSYIAGSQSLPSLPSGLKSLKHESLKNMARWAATDGTDHILYGQGSWSAVANVCQAVLDGSMTPEDGAAQIQSDVLATRSR